MYEQAEMHGENGAWQMIFGCQYDPAYRKHGYAGRSCSQCAIEDARKQGREEGTCVDVQGKIDSPNMPSLDL